MAIEEGTCKRVRQVKTAIGEWGGDAGGWVCKEARVLSFRIGGESARSYMVTVTVTEVVIVIGEVYVRGGR